MTDALSALSIARDLLRCPSVTPADAGALGVLETILQAAGFEVHRVTFGEPGTADIDNLYARIGTSAPHITFAGHTDVVPPGDESAWTHGAFSGDVKDGFLYGRGAVDMKGGIACSVAAVLDYLAANDGKPKGSISFLITGDEEDISVNGTIKLLQWAAARGEKFDHCVLGEPSNVEELGDCIKIGRRGSLHGMLYVDGIQGHVAYPHRAANPVPDISRLIVALSDEPLDHGSAQFQASNLEFTSVDVGNKAGNVIPGQARAKFNIRFNDLHTQETLRQLVDAAPGQGVRQPDPRADRVGAVEFQCVRDQTRPLHRSRGRRDRGRHRPQAGTEHQRRHLGCAVYFELLPGDRVRPGRPDHAPDRRAHAGVGPGEADEDLSRRAGPVFWVTVSSLAPACGERVGAGLSGSAGMIAQLAHIEFADACPSPAR